MRKMAAVAGLAVLAIGCGADVEVPPSIADQVSAAERSREPAAKAPPPDAEELEPDPEPEVEPEPEPEPEPDVDTAAIEAACADLLDTFGDQVAPDDDAFVDLARTWRQRSLVLAETASTDAADEPTFAVFVETTAEAASALRAVHVAAEEGDADAVSDALAAFGEVGPRIETEAEALGLTGCLQEPDPVTS